MKCIIAIAFAVILVVAEGRPDGAETQQASTVQPMQLNDYIKQAQTQITNLGTQLQEQLSLPNQQELVNTLKEQSNTLAENVRSYINTMSDEVSKCYFCVVVYGPFITIERKIPFFKMFYCNIETMR